jgi:hypothetical protein
VVAKVLRNLTPKFNHMVITIEVSKDPSTYTFDEFMRSQAYETKFSILQEKNDENVFFLKGWTSKSRSRGNTGT